MTDHRDDRELERLMKEGLETRAREADVDVPVADRARSAARSGRWRTATAAGLAAASVVAVAGGVALLGDDDRRSGGRDVAGDRDLTPTVVDEWRTEYWHDIAVDVPADWGWGGSPMADSIGRGNQLVACAAGAFRAPGVTGAPDFSGTPYVGRPFTLTDTCELFRDGQWREPEAPYLWFGSPIEPGTREFDNGFVQETIEFEGEPVTVATDDPSLREQILDSVRAGETCFSELEAPPRSTQFFDGVGESFSSLTVCAYRRDTAGETLRLAYVSELPASSARELLEAVDGRGAESPPKSQACGVANVFVELHLTTSGGDEMTLAVDLGECPGIEVGERLVELTEATVQPWAVGGLPTILYAPWAWDEPWMVKYFTGPQG